MPPIGDKVPSNESLASSSRRTRARYNALPENLPGLKTRSGKQIKSPKIGKSTTVSSVTQVSSPKLTPRTTKHNKESCLDVSKRGAKAIKSRGTGSANKAMQFKKKKVKFPQTDNVQHKCKTNSDVKKLVKRKGQNDVHTRSSPQSKTSCKQDRKTKSDGKHYIGKNKSKKTKKVGKQTEMSVDSADRHYGKGSALKQSKPVAESRQKKFSYTSNRKAEKRKISISKDQDESCSGDIYGQVKPIKKAKYSEESEICSPRRSSRAIVPNRKFKDMKMDWDITTVKKESVAISESPEKIQIKEEEKPVVRKVEVNSFAPGQLIKVTEPIKKKSSRSKNVSKKIQKADVRRSVETQQDEKPNDLNILSTTSETEERKLEEIAVEKKPSLNFMKTETPKRTLENISTEIRANTTIKIQLPERTFGDAATDPHKMFLSSVTSPTPESPIKSDVNIIKTLKTIDDSHSKVQVQRSSKHVASKGEISLSERPKGRTVMKITSKGTVLTDKTEYSSLQEKGNLDLDYISDEFDYSESNSVENPIVDSDSNHSSVVAEVVSETSDIVTEESGDLSEMLTIELRSEQIEVHDMTNLVTDATGCMDLKSSTDLSNSSFIVETSEKNSRIHSKISNTVVEATAIDSALAIIKPMSQEKSNLPYRVIPSLNVGKKGFVHVIDLKENSRKSSDILLHRAIKPRSVVAIKPQGLIDSEKVIGNNSRTTVLTHRPATQPTHSLLKTQKSLALSYVKEIVIKPTSTKNEQIAMDPECITNSVKKDESDDALIQTDSESVHGLNNKSTATHDSDFDSSDEGSILNAATGLLEIPISLLQRKKLIESVQNTNDHVGLETQDIPSCSNSGDAKDKNLSCKAEEKMQETSDVDLEIASNKAASTATQTPLTDKTDFCFDGDQNQSEMKLKTKTISVSVQKPGEELQVKDGEVTAEAQKQEFIIVHLPEGTTIKNYTVQSRNKIEDDIAFTQDDNGQYICGECNYATMKKANWYKHKRRHMGQCVKTHACNYCSYRASTSSNLKRHLSIHDDIRLFKCGICELTFRQKIHLERHIKYRHEVKQVRCPLCDYVCANENPDLKVHIKRKHLHPDGNGDSVEVFTCSECGLTTLSRKDLKQHQKFHRKGPELKLFCEHCSFVTDCESRLKRHMYIHTKEKPFECSLCDYRGSQKEHVLRHMQAQHNIEIQRQSQKSFVDSTSSEDSNDGKGTDNDIADYSSQEKIFACNHCTMKFAKLINLYKHLHSQHKDIMPYEEGDNYQCVVCDFTTNNKKNLLVHMRRHNVVKQNPPSHVYSCVLCQYVNPERKNLFQHMKNQHGIDITMKDDGSASCFVTEDNPVVPGHAETRIQTIDNIFAGTDSPLQIVTDESASTSAQNVITVQDLAYAISNPRLVNDSDVVIVEHGQETNVNNIQINSLVQHEAAEAIEGLQALAEQSGIFETQTVIVEEPAIIDHSEVETTIEEIQNVVNTKVELIENSDILVQEEAGDEQVLEAEAVEQITTDSKELDASIQLSAEEVMQLTSGDYVEINGEMYKVEIQTDDTATTVDTPGEEAVEEVIV